MQTVPSLTLVLMGPTGNGKSATGNTILGRKAFESRKSSSCVTKTSQLQTCVRKDGQVINVIDTPGMFNLSNGTESTPREIMKSIDLASGSIHAVLLVFSVRNRFTQEEVATIQTLQNTFGPKIVDYAIVVLTGGDELDDEDDSDNDSDDDNDTALEDYLSNVCPAALKTILAACKNRCVVFDNKTKSESKNDEQVNELLDLVNEMIEQNGGRPYKPGSIPSLKLQEELNVVKSKLDQSCTQDLYTHPKLEEKLNETVPSLTLVLMGRTGNGKSATGNTILGRKAFESRKSSSCVTKASQLQTCVRKDGQVIKVIDTPGMFNLSNGTRSTSREIMKCIDLASGSIHAVLLVFSVRNRFTQEEEATIKTLQNTFGSKIVDYAIVVLTGGDELNDDNDSDDDNDAALEDYLSNVCPAALKAILAACKNRCVVFDNKTKSESKNDEQLNELLDLVHEMIEQNGGRPYKPGSIPSLKLQEELNVVKRKLDQSCTQDLRTHPKLEEKANEMVLDVCNKYEQQLAQEREARRQVEGRAQQLLEQYRDEIQNNNEQIRVALQRPAAVEVEQNNDSGTPVPISRLIRRLITRLIRRLLRQI